MMKSNDTLRRMLLGNVYNKCMSLPGASEQELMSQFRHMQNQGCLAGVEFEDFVSMCNLRSGETPSEVVEVKEVETQLEDEAGSPVLFYPLAQPSSSTKRPRTSPLRSSPTFRYTPPSSIGTARNSLFDISQPVNSQFVDSQQEAQNQLWF